MTTIKILDTETGKELGSVVTNRSLNRSEIFRLAGTFEWKTYPDVEADGWYQDDILYDEDNTELVAE